MKNQVSPPVATTARPVPLARAKLSKFQWMRLALQASPVRRVVPAEALRFTLLYCLVMSATASATAEFGTSMIASTFSTWYHCRAMSLRNRPGEGKQRQRTPHPPLAHASGTFSPRGEGGRASFLARNVLRRVKQQKDTGAERPFPILKNRFPGASRYGVF